MTEFKWISYLRVSTNKQGKLGLGIKAQRDAVEQFLNGGRLLKEYVEVESGLRSDRPRLVEAIAACKAYGARLVIAKVDRSRDAHFLFGLQKAGIDFVAADNSDTNRLTVGIGAVVAEDESRLISQRTKDELAAAKKRGVKLGGYKGIPMLERFRRMGTVALKARADAKTRNIVPIIKEKAGRTSPSAIAEGLNEKGVPTVSGKDTWTAIQVARVLERQVRAALEDAKKEWDQRSG